MIFKKIDDKIFKSYWYITYPFFVFLILILYLNGYITIMHFIKLKCLLYNIFFLNLIIFIFFLVPRYFFLNNIKLVNRWFFNNCKFVLKLRYYLTDFFFLLLKIFSIFFIEIDNNIEKFIINFYKEEKFILYFFFFNFKLILFRLPYFFLNFIYSIYKTIEGLESKEFIIAFYKLKIVFIIISIFFLLIFSGILSRFYFIIIIYLLDDIIAVYYNWYKDYFELKKYYNIDNMDKKKKNEYKLKILKLSFSKLDIANISYLHLILKLIIIRKEAILLFKGLNIDEILELNLNYCIKKFDFDFILIDIYFIKIFKQMVIEFELLDEKYFNIQLLILYWIYNYLSKYDFDYSLIYQDNFINLFSIFSFKYLKGYNDSSFFNEIAKEWKILYYIVEDLIEELKINKEFFLNFKNLYNKYDKKVYITNFLNDKEFNKVKDVLNKIIR